tara:strand:- start:3045 stop:4253 length:1209 start_codon:yes stop_codon:yes gene_type:complete
MLTVGSLFAGIGGFDLGLQRAGMSVQWQVEIDTWAREVLAKHWPDATRYEDVREVGAHNLAPVDVICGGFPCQDISNAGKRAGIEGERSGLWSEYARIIRELRPRYVIVENVAALLTRGLDTVLGDLAESGYDAEWDIISAAAVGAPHLRERVWIVAYDANSDSGSKEQGFSQGAAAELCGNSNVSYPNSAAMRDTRRGAVQGRSSGTVDDGSEEPVAYPNCQPSTVRGDDLTDEAPGGRRRAHAGRSGTDDRGIIGTREDGSVADPEDERIDRRERLALDDEPESRGRHTDSRGSGTDVRQQGDASGRRWTGETMGDPLCGELEGVRPAREQKPQGRRSEVEAQGASNGAWEHWAVEPDVGRVAHGVPRRVDRLRGLGNAVVPQVVEWIGRRICADVDREE